MTRAQSNVVGVALLVAITVVAVGTLTASIGTVVDGSAATADATRVSESIDDALQPVETTGVRERPVSFTDGTLTTDERTLRVMNESHTITAAPIDALVFTAGDQRVEYSADGVIQGERDTARLVSEPPITAAGSPDRVLIVGVPVLNASHQSVSGAPVRATLRTEVTHDRRSLGDDHYRVAVETPHPDVWAEYFRSLDATIEATDEQFEGDEHPSVVAAFPDERTGYLVVHELNLEVSTRG